MKNLIYLLMISVSIICINSCSSSDDNYDNGKEKPKRDIFITKFSINGRYAKIDNTSNEISMTVPLDYDLRTLKPIIILSNDVTVSPKSGSEIDFTQNVTYTITDNTDITNIKKYTVKISKEVNNESKILSFSINGKNATINEDKKAIDLTLAYGIDITSLVPNIKISRNASVAPSSGTIQNFSNPVEYEVIAENGLKSKYTVTISVTPFNTEITSITPQLALSGDAVTIKGRFATSGNKVYYELQSPFVGFVKKEVRIMTESASEIKIVVPDITSLEGKILDGGTLTVISNGTKATLFSVEFYDKDKTIIEKINKTSFKIGDPDEVIILTGRNLKAKNPNYYSIIFSPVIQGLGNSHKYATSSDFKVNESGTELTFSRSNGIHVESNQYYLEITGNTQSNKIKVSFKK